MNVDATDGVSDCAICRALACGSPEASFGTRHWRVRRHDDPAPIAGWTIIDLRRHAEGIGSLLEDEARELGPLLRDASAAIQRATGCDRVYVLSFAEVVRHAHLHLVPRHEADPHSAGWSIADLARAVANGRRQAAESSDCDRIMALVRQALTAHANDGARPHA